MQAAIIAAIFVLTSAAAEPGSQTTHPLGTRLLVLTQAQQNRPAKVYSGTGVVTAVEPNGALTINHQPIEGLMPAMEMMFSVATPDVSNGVHPGDEVAFDVDGTRYVILALKVVRRAR
ncbi:MAG TPA: copper-binding protein [Acetobacteraceae bacterium]|nr:copper-binding protein [Acetobacteraceae bacterium]